jgi:prepilin-type N-terminal cleavage/methylation domain-containing protein/prepilin-type processing-associated H-X9-DG protein
MSSIFNSRRRSGFTLIELLVVIAIIAILAAILFPVFAKARAKARQASGASNQKQIALAFLQYLQDYDEKFPPIYGVGAGGQYQHWGIDYIVTNGTTSVTYTGLLSPYTKSDALFVDPSGTRAPSGGTICDYLYNDLVAGKTQAAMAAVSSTVLTCDGNGADVVGNSTTPGFFGVNGVAYGQRVTAAGSAEGAGNSSLAAGHAIGTAIKETDFAPNGGSPIGDDRDVVSTDQVGRQSDGGNFSYADGHVKWAKVTLDTTKTPPVPASVYFPSQTETNTAAATDGSGSPLGTEPVPGGNMGNYVGTFHLD